MFTHTLTHTHTHIYIHLHQQARRVAGAKIQTSNWCCINMYIPVHNTYIYTQTHFHANAHTFIQTPARAGAPFCQRQEYKHPTGACQGLNLVYIFSQPVPRPQKRSKRRRARCPFLCTAHISKETFKYKKRPTKKTHQYRGDLQKRPTKETYKRDLLDSRVDRHDAVHDAHLYTLQTRQKIRRNMKHTYQTSSLSIFHIQETHLTST